MAYELDAPVCEIWARFHAPAPRLPLEPAAFRRTWLLSPETVPLDASGLQQLPGPSGGASHISEQEQIAALLKPYLPLAQFHLQDWQLRQRQILAEANARLRNQRRPGRVEVLSDVLNPLIQECTKAQESLVVDTLSLEEAGIALDTPVRSKSSLD